MKAIERLPAIPTSLHAKALALSWIDSSETLFDDRQRDSYATDGKLGFDIEQIVIAQALAEPERAAFTGLIEPQIAAAGLDLAGQSNRTLGALHEIATTLERIGHAFTCQPRCQAGEGPHGGIVYNAAGELADWLVTVMGFVMEGAKQEAQRRAPDPIEDDDRLSILADSAINNGDRDELHALIRDLQAKARRDARG